MNKIKVLYDVVKVMRDKDAYNGNIEATISKDEVQVAQFSNEFTRDLASGWTKARISTVVDHNGKQIKHESTTEFNQKDENRRSAFTHCGHLHNHIRHGQWDQKHHGLKERLDGLLVVLNALNNLKVAEQADKSVKLSLDLTGIPEELQNKIKERLEHRHHASNPNFKKIHSIKNGTLECLINPQNEVEIIELKLDGKVSGENDEAQEVSCRAEIRFSW